MVEWKEACAIIIEDLTVYRSAYNQTSRSFYCALINDSVNNIITGLCPQYFMLWSFVWMNDHKVYPQCGWDVTSQQLFCGVYV